MSSKLLDDCFEEPELADDLGVHVQTVRRWWKNREGPPCVEITKRRRVYPRAAVMAWMQSRLRHQPRNKRQHRQTEAVS
jgi:predicted DNA-binding transcriptional regulator AlpA